MGLNFRPRSLLYSLTYWVIQSLLTSLMGLTNFNPTVYKITCMVKLIIIIIVWSPFPMQFCLYELKLVAAWYNQFPWLCICGATHWIIWYHQTYFRNGCYSLHYTTLTSGSCCSWWQLDVRLLIWFRPPSESLKLLRLIHPFRST